MKDLFTIDEIIQAGFVYVATPSFITDKNHIVYDIGACSIDDVKDGKFPIVVRTFMIVRTIDMDKKKIIEKIKEKNYKFIHSIKTEDDRIIFVRGCKAKVL